LNQLEAQGLRLIIEKAGGGTVAAARTMKLDLVGLDRPGFIRDLSRILAAQQASISELGTKRGTASFSGEAMFKARAVLQMPEGLGVDKLRGAIESLANEMMADLSHEGSE
jgi:glycine cleavage system regulatory protein